MPKFKLIGEDVKAWLAAGWQETCQIFELGVQQIKPVNLPGQLFVPTTGEATATRLADKETKSPFKSYDVPEKE
jgi:hypothetical protein